MLRKMILSSDTAGEITLPVTPESYNVSTEMSVQVIDVYELGQYAAPTYPTLQTIKIECLLPSSARSYCVSYTEQSTLIKWLDARMKEKTRLRYIVSGTAVNVPVYLAGVEYGEKDGTNDLYASLTLREYRTLSAPEVLPGTSGAATRETSPQQNAQGTHIVKRGDTLWAIAKKYYGDGSLCYKLAAYNGIKNANIISVGQVIKLPDAATLGRTAPAKAVSTQKASAQKASYTATISKTGKKNTGWLSYSYTDCASGKKASGHISSSIKLTVSSGTRIVLYWKPKDGFVCDIITIDGKPQKAGGNASGGYYHLSMTADHEFIANWVRA